jgi:hypothetical protein
MCRPTMGRRWGEIRPGSECPSAAARKPPARAGEQIVVLGVVTAILEA